MEAAVHYYDLVKVWPLKDGLVGLSPSGMAATLTPGIPGWMHRNQVGAAVRNGDVQSMIGLRPKDLKAVQPGTPVEPETAETPSNREIKRRKRRQYARRDVTAEQEPVPFIHGAPPVPPPTPKG